MNALRTLDAFDRIQNESGGLEARVTQNKLKQIILKKYLENLCCFLSPVPNVHSSNEVRLARLGLSTSLGYFVRVTPCHHYALDK